MKKWIVCGLMLLLLFIPVNAVELETAPEPQTGAEYMTESTGDFAQDLLYIIKNAFQALLPDLRECLKHCIRLFATVLLSGIASTFIPGHEKAVQICSVCCLALLMFSASRSLVILGANTVTEISQYSKLLLPVMTASMAAQGGTVTAGALYAATAVFDAILSTLISSALVPMIYALLALSVLYAATEEEILKKLRDFFKWLITWSLKMILYVFIGYISITGVISGTTDQMKLKAMKLTISGTVPVIGSILSDASEAVLVSAGVVKNAAGVYGVLAFAAITAGPFLKIGAQYVFLKLTGFFGAIVGHKSCQDLIDHFAAAMGLLLAMTGSVCLLQMISLICYLRGMGI